MFLSDLTHVNVTIWYISCTHESTWVHRTQIYVLRKMSLLLWLLRAWRNVDDVRGVLENVGLLWGRTRDVTLWDTLLFVLHSWKPSTSNIWLAECAVCHGAPPLRTQRCAQMHTLKSILKHRSGQWGKGKVASPPSEDQGYILNLSTSSSPYGDMYTTVPLWTLPWICTSGNLGRN